MSSGRSASDSNVPTDKEVSYYYINDNEATPPIYANKPYPIGKKNRSTSIPSVSSNKASSSASSASIESVRAEFEGELETLRAEVARLNYVVEQLVEDMKAMKERGEGKGGEAAESSSGGSRRMSANITTSTSSLTEKPKSE